MTQHRGRPNRVPLSRYREAFPSASFAVTHLVGREEPLAEPLPCDGVPANELAEAVHMVREHRHRFSSAFRGERDEDLAVAAFRMVLVT